MKQSRILGGSIGMRCLAAVAGAGLAACGSGDPQLGMPGPGGGGGPATLPGYMYVLATTGVPSSAGLVYQYAVDAAGTITPLAPSSIATGAVPTALAVDPSGHHIYVVNSGEGTISQFEVGADGRLVAMAPASVTNLAGPQGVGGPAGIAIEPAGHFLYVANTSSDSISQFRVNSAGSLAALSPTTISTGPNPMGLAMEPGGNELYVANFGSGNPGSGNVGQYRIAIDGTLASLSPATVAAGDHPVAVTVTPDGGRAFVMSNCNGLQCTGAIFPFRVAAGGALVANGVSMETAGHYNAVSLVFNGLAKSGYLLSNLMGVDTSSGAVWQYTLDASGSLAGPSAPVVDFSPHVAAAQFVVGSSLFALTWDFGIAPVPHTARVSRYAIASNGSLALAATTPLSFEYPVAMVYVSRP